MVLKWVCFLVTFSRSSRKLLVLRDILFSNMKWMLLSLIWVAEPCVGACSEQNRRCVIILLGMCQWWKPFSWIVVESMIYGLTVCRWFGVWSCWGFVVHRSRLWTYSYWVFLYLNFWVGVHVGDFGNFILILEFLVDTALHHLEEFFAPTEHLWARVQLFDVGGRLSDKETFHIIY